MNQQQYQARKKPDSRTSQLFYLRVLNKYINVTDGFDFDGGCLDASH